MGRKKEEKIKKVTYRDIEYEIIDNFTASDIEGHHDYQVLETSRTIVKTIFPIIPLWIGNKFRWFKSCKVRYRLYISRRKDFDDGWSYKYYWKSWKHEFRPEKILS